MLHQEWIEFDHNIVALSELRILDKLEFSPVNGHRGNSPPVGLMDELSSEPLCSFSSVLETIGFSELAFMSKWIGFSPFVEEFIEITLNFCSGVRGASCLPQETKRIGRMRNKRCMVEILYYDLSSQTRRGKMKFDLHVDSRVLSRKESDKRLKLLHLENRF